jgi:OOP family OmpA-OmpF porin
MKKVVKLLVASIVAISANSATAEPGAIAEPAKWYESGKWYIGAGVGQSNYNDGGDIQNEFESSLGVVNFVGTQSASSDDKDTGFKLFGGYSFHKNFAVELSYIDMGKADANGSASGTFSDTLGNSVDADIFTKAKAEVDAFTLDLNLSVPIPSTIATVIVKAGAYTADTKLDLDASSSIPNAENISESKTYNSTGLHYGIGVNFTITDVIGLRAEWERLDSVKANGGKNDVDLLSAALIYNF